MFIYKITNKINNKVYIGKTSRSILIRFKEHVRESKYGKHPLHRAMRKYGIENFSVELLYEARTEDELNSKEIEFISQIPDNTYNITMGGDGKLLYDRATIESIFQATQSFSETARRVGCCYDVVAEHLTSSGYSVDRLANSIKAKAKKVISDLGTFDSIGEAATFCVKNGLARSRDSCARSIQDSCANRRNKVCGVKWNYLE